MEFLMRLFWVWIICMGVQATVMFVRYIFGIQGSAALVSDATVLALILMFFDWTSVDLSEGDNNGGR